MENRDVDPRDPVVVAQPFGDLVLRSPPNWTAVGFFGMLGALYLMISIPTLVGGRWEGYLSLAFGTIFILVAAVSSRSARSSSWWPPSPRVAATRWRCSAQNAASGSGAGPAGSASSAPSPSRS